MHASQQTQLQPDEARAIRIEASVKRDEYNLKEVPERHSSPTTGGMGSDIPSARGLTSSQHLLEQSSTSNVPAQPAALTWKIIFCTGGGNHEWAASIGATKCWGFGGSDIYTDMIL